MLSDISEEREGMTWRVVREVFEDWNIVRLSMLAANWESLRETPGTSVRLGMSASVVHSLLRCIVGSIVTSEGPPCFRTAVEMAAPLNTRERFQIQPSSSQDCAIFLPGKQRKCQSPGPAHPYVLLIKYLFDCVAHKHHQFLQFRHLN